MKLNHLFIVLLAGSAILAGCKKDEPKEETKKDALITFTAKYGETIEGVAKPEKAVLTIDNAKVDVVDGKFNAEILGETETHLVAAYNEVAGVTMDNGVLSLGAEGAQLPSADWMFAYAENKKLTKASTSLSVTLKQQTKQINVIVRSLGGKSNNISEATAELTGVAAQKDILNNVYNLRYQNSCLPGECTSGFHYQFKMWITDMKVVERGNQKVNVVVAASHQMTSSEVDPLYLPEPF